MSEATVREPMTDEEISTYVDYIISQMDDEQVLTAEGFDFLENQDTVPTAEDQEKITTLLEERYSDQSTESNTDQEEGAGNDVQEEATCAADPVAEV